MKSNEASPASQAGNQFDCFQALEGLEALHTYPIIFKNEDSFPPLKKKKTTTTTTTTSTTKTRPHVPYLHRFARLQENVKQ